ncbi:hypothetical protein [Streptomyces sp. NPDC051662]|uniref:hypothetical protein n=1 Tax=Streptomyces sp. NPDC051662 TaxID=3154750 RepID=UPI003427B586
MRDLMQELGFEMSIKERSKRKALMPKAEQLLSSWDQVTDKLVTKKGTIEALNYQKSLRTLRDFFTVNADCFPEGFHRYAQDRIGRQRCQSGQNSIEQMRRSRQTEDIGDLFSDILGDPPKRPTRHTNERVEVERAAFDWPTLLIGASLSPFLQAISTTYGNQAAERIGLWARFRLRRIIRREIQTGAGTGIVEPGRRPGIPVPTLQLTEEKGCKVLLDAYIPLEAVAELFNLDFTILINEYDSPPYIIWSCDAQLWRAQGTKNRAALYSSWNSTQRRWHFSAMPGDEPESSSS